MIAFGSFRRVDPFQPVDRRSGPSVTGTMKKQFTCPHCRHAHRFLAGLAGQSMHCQGCGFVFRIPLVPLAQVEGVDFSQAGRWLLRLAGGRQFGPVRREIILEWLREGRADADSLVAPEAGKAWYRVGEVFPQALRESPTGRADRSASAGLEEAGSPASIIPAAQRSASRLLSASSAHPFQSASASSRRLRNVRACR